MEYTLSTGHGILEFKCRPTAEATLQGSGQGRSQSPIMCTCSINVILDAMEEAGHPIGIEHPSRKEGTTSTRYSNKFVDDQSNGKVIFGDGIEECARKLEINRNFSNSLLNASGGGNNIDQSYCYRIEQVPKDEAWWMKRLEVVGKPYIYYPEESKLILVVWKRDTDAATKFKQDKDAAVVILNGHRYLGGFVGDKDLDKVWVEEQVEAWIEAIEALREAVKFVPQAEFLGMQCSLQ
jgi:hypothetical protein